MATGTRAGSSLSSPTSFDPAAFRTARQARIGLVEFAREFGEPALPSPSHIFIVFEGTADVNVTLYGQPYIRRVFAVRGQLVQPIDGYNPDLIAIRVARQIAGQVSLEVGDGNTTLIEGIDVDIISTDVRVISTELRGSTRRG